MNSVLVEIICPATGRVYDCWIAKGLRVLDVTLQLIGVIRKIEGDINLFSLEKAIQLFSETGVCLNPNFTVKQAGVTSGSKLLLA